MRPFIFLLFFSLPVFAEINLDTQQLSVEYGTSFHTINGEQTDNGSKGRLTTNQMPYVNGSYTFAIGSSWGMQFFGGVQFLKFNEPAGTFTLKNEEIVLTNYGLELQKKLSPLARLGIFGRHQDHPLYFAKSPTEIEVLKAGFFESGVHYLLSQRRRVGLLWGLGTRAFLLFPTAGGNVATETGAGAEGYARLGWIGPFGTQFLLKGFYQYATAPNAEITFSHENLGYAFLVSYSF